jgi:hypothetical protein
MVGNCYDWADLKGVKKVMVFSRFLVAKVKRGSVFLEDQVAILVFRWLFHYFKWAELSLEYMPKKVAVSAKKDF